MAAPTKNSSRFTPIYMNKEMNKNREKPETPLTSLYTFTIFIPTFNRAKHLEETLLSVEKSHFKNFEVIIIDDGSSDQTYLVVAEARGKVHYPITYIFQKNSGKAGAHNTALQYAQGEFFMNLDAGDFLLPDAMTKLLNKWTSYTEDDSARLAGISALCLNEDGKLSGEKYPEGIGNISYLELESVAPLSGEKRQAIRTEILRRFPYPRIPGESHIRPTLIMRRMAHEYKLMWLNEPIQVNVRESDGITANIYKYRMENPKGFRLFFLEEITSNRKYFGKRKLYGDHWRYIMFSLHSGVTFRQQSKEVQDRLLWVLSIPKGTIKWLIDRYRMKKR